MSKAGAKAEKMAGLDFIQQITSKLSNEPAFPFIKNIFFSSKSEIWIRRAKWEIIALGENKIKKNDRKFIQVLSALKKLNSNCPYRYEKYTLNKNINLVKTIKFIQIFLQYVVASLWFNAAYCHINPGWKTSISFSSTI